MFLRTKFLHKQYFISLSEHLIPDHKCTESPTDCFTTCLNCCPPQSPRQRPASLHRSNSRSSEDLRKEERPRRHARRHSFPSVSSDVSNTPVYNNTPTFYGPASPTYYNGPVYIYMVPSPTVESQPHPAPLGFPLPEVLQLSTTATPTHSSNPSPSFTPTTHSSNPASSSTPHHSPCHTPKCGVSPQPSVMAHIIHPPVTVQQQTMVTSSVPAQGCLPNGTLFLPDPSPSNVRQRHLIHRLKGEGDNATGQQRDENTNTVSETEAIFGRDEPVDPLCTFLHSLFNVFPYRLFRNFYHHKCKERVRLFFVLFILCQGFAAILITLCEDGGFQAVFRSKDCVLKEILYRLLLFSLRVSLRVITPLCCVFQLPKLASKPQIPHTSGLTRETAVERLMKVHETFSSDEEVMEIQNNHSKIYEMSEEITKRRIQPWMSVLHAVCYTALLFYLGAFYIAEQKIMKGGVCNFVGSTIITLPLLGTRIHLIVVFECISIFILVLLIGVVKDCYTYENKVAALAAIIGGNATKLQQEIRKRWAILDQYCYVAPLAMALFTMLTILNGKAFTPQPQRDLLKASDLVTWYFWITILSILKFLGFSPNRMVRWGGLMAHGIVSIFILVVQVETVSIPPGSVFILAFISLAVILFNLLLSLTMSLYYCAYAQETSTGVVSRRLLLFCMFCLLLLPVSVVALVYREVVHYANFVAWS